MTSCQTCVVRNQAICSALSAPELEVLSRIGRHVPIRRGETLIWEGDESALVANVIEGVLKLSTSTADGREQIVGVVYPSDFIGRPFGGTAQHSVTALSDAQLCLFTRAAFDGFAHDYPQLQHKLLERTLTELDRARGWMLALGRKSAGERVATFLLDMAERLGGASCDASQQPSQRFDLPLTRQQMGDLLGLTIETVSRQLTRLRQAGIIDLPDRRGVVILDREAMEVEAGNG
ncbi:MAG TPA: Crp/Fnr family transcriptional regulator [Sphingobium sp.]|nr:Crp/Fnr family transcriptional regulator [Sphingobium sp.]